MSEIEKVRLQNLIESDDGINWWNKDLFIDKILPFFPKELEIIELPPAYESNYNCFVYAFKLNNDEYFVGKKNPIYQEFVKYLIKKDVLKIKQKQETEDLVIWVTDSREYSHIGILKDEDKIISKWMWGPIIENDINDFPISFGENIIYIENPDPKIIKEEYIKYKNSGVYIPEMR